MRAKIMFIVVAVLPVFFVFATAAQIDGNQVYGKNCQKCHGPEGKGDGPAAKFLKGQSMGDFTNGEEMSKYSDDDLYKLISEGGKAVGKSKIMTAYKDKLDEAQIRAVISHLKTLY